MAEAPVDTAPETVEAGMTDEQRFLFDLQGYIVVPDALSADELSELNAILDHHIAERAPEERTHRFGGLLTWSEPYRALVDNPRLRPHVEQIVGQRFRLDHLESISIIGYPRPIVLSQGYSDRRSWHEWTC
jgi:hypothetical protein